MLLISIGLALGYGYGIAILLAADTRHAYQLPTY
jgi:hypothetical protein